MKAEYDFSKAKRGAIKSSAGKTRITIYLDDDLLEHFRDVATLEGLGYQTVINRTLRAAAATAQLPAGNEGIDASALLVEIRNTLNEVKERLPVPSAEPTRGGGRDGASEGVAQRRNEAAGHPQRRGSSGAAVDERAPSSSSAVQNTSSKRQAESKGSRLSKEVAGKMLDLLISDDRYRSLFVSNPSVAIREAGAPATHADAFAALGQMQVKSLASKEEIRASYDPILDFLISIEFTPAHASAVVLCFEEGASRIREKKRQSSSKSVGSDKPDEAAPSSRQRRR